MSTQGADALRFYLNRTRLAPCGRVRLFYGGFMNKYKPVPKVLAQTIAGLIAAAVVAALVQYGVAQEQAGEVGSAVTALVIALAPVIVGFVAGWLKTDTERAALLKIIEDQINALADGD